MKFTQLPMGARFEFQGQVYVKSGPIAATAESGGQRMIPRYAVLRPLDDFVPEALPRPRRSLDEAAVLAAFEAFHDTCARLLVDDAARQALVEARARFLAALDPAPAREDGETA